MASALRLFSSVASSFIPSSIEANIASLAHACGLVGVAAFSLGVAVWSKSFSGLLMIFFRCEMQGGDYSGLLAIALAPALFLDLVRSPAPSAPAAQ